MAVTGNMRSKLFGGFDRHDVSKYVVTLANERNELKARVEQLEAENEALRRSLQEAVAETDAENSEEGGDA